VGYSSVLKTATSSEVKSLQEYENPIVDNFALIPLSGIPLLAILILQGILKQ